MGIKAKLLLMGIFSIVVAVCIGVLGINSINRNGRNSEIEAIVNEMDVLQAKNLALEAQYQYYIDQSYLAQIRSNLEQMTANAELLQRQAGGKYKEDVDMMLDRLTRSRENYSNISEYSSTRGFDGESGLYQQYLEAGSALTESFKGLVDKQEWLEIKWIDAQMWSSGERVVIDDKNYVKLVYTGPVPEKVKRNSMAFRIGGTLTYHNNSYITDIKLTNGTDEMNIDLGTVESVSGSGLAYVDSELTTFDGQPAIRVGCNFNAANEGWEEFAVQISVKEYPVQDYHTIVYTLYLEPTDLSFDYKYGGSYSGVYSFETSHEQLDSMVNAYSKLVVEGKAVPEDYAKIEALAAELAENIPLYTSSGDLAQDSIAKLNAKKEFLQQMKALDDKILALKAENVVLNNELSALCTTVKDKTSADMVQVKATVQRVSIIVIVLASMILVGMTVLIGTGIDRTVMLFRQALDKITDRKSVV